MSDLQKYQQKRDFSKTPEPEDENSSSNKKVFVIQKHDATQLHYDLRLNIDGVLKSWSVPKGPTLNPDKKRLAIQTEDHPYSYKDFEGIIPKDEYGGGVVMVWDQGEYENLSENDGQEVDIKNAWDKGHIKIKLKGKKLEGDFVLIRTSKKSDKKSQWLLMKKDDEYGDRRRKVVKSEPNSAKSGKSLEEIAEV